MLARPHMQKGWVEKLRASNASRDGGAAPGHTHQPLRKPCAEQFPDRPVLATCSQPMTAFDGGGGAASLLSYYTIEILESDAEMKGCLRNRDEWKALPHDADGYMEALSAAASRRLAKMKGGRGL